MSQTMQVEKTVVDATGHVFIEILSGAELAGYRPDIYSILSKPLVHQVVITFRTDSPLKTATFIKSI